MKLKYCVARVAELLRAMDGYQGHFVTKCALRLAPLFFVRPGELRKAEWVEIDLDKAAKAAGRTIPEPLPQPDVDNIEPKTGA